MISINSTLPGASWSAAARSGNSSWGIKSWCKSPKWILSNDRWITSSRPGKSLYRLDLINQPLAFHAFQSEFQFLNEELALTPDPAFAGQVRHGRVFVWSHRHTDVQELDFKTA